MYLHYADFMPVDWHPQLKGERERMRHLALALVLACVLSGTAAAGEIPTTGAPAPHGSSSLAMTGEIPSGDRTGEIPTSDRTGEIPSSDATAPDTLLTIIVSLLTIGR
jgi:hypothetical protein